MRSALQQRFAIAPALAPSYPSTQAFDKLTDIVESAGRGLAFPNYYCQLLTTTTDQNGRSASSKAVGDRIRASSK
jgi:hypothetical protein